MGGLFCFLVWRVIVLNVITVDGFHGVGKSSCIRKLVEYLESKNLSVATLDIGSGVYDLFCTIVRMKEEKVLPQINSLLRFVNYCYLVSHGKGLGSDVLILDRSYLFYCLGFVRDFDCLVPAASIYIYCSTKTSVERQFFRSLRETGHDGELSLPEYSLPDVVSDEDKKHFEWLVSLSNRYDFFHVVDGSGDRESIFEGVKGICDSALGLEYG